MKRHGARAEHDTESATALAGAESDQIRSAADESIGRLVREYESQKNDLKIEADEIVKQINSLQKLQILTEMEYRERSELAPGVFKAGMGAEAVYEVVRKLNMDDLAASLRRRCPAHERSAAQEGDEAPARRRGAAQERQPAGVDDLHRAAGDPTGTAPDGAVRRRPLRDLRSERPVSPRHQPQQSVEAAAGPRTRRTSSSATRSACFRKRSTR